jgi:hypothetical protein
MLTVKQYSRSLLSTVGMLLVLRTSRYYLWEYSLFDRTSMIVEVRAAGLVLLPVAVGVGVRWDSLLW